MKTFSRKRNSSNGSAGSREASVAGVSLSPKTPADGPLCSFAASADWASLPDGALQLIAQALPSADRPRCRLVCRGWVAPSGAAVEQLELSLSPLPREAFRQLVAAHICFPSALDLSLRFPNFLLAPPAPSATTRDTRDQQERMKRPALRQYAAPLLGAGVPIPVTVPIATACRGSIGPVGGGPGPDAGSGCVLANVTRLTLTLGLAGHTALPLDAFFRLPHLTALTLGGLAPNATAAAVAQTGAGGDGDSQPSETTAPLGLVGFPALSELKLSGLLSYRVLLEVAQVTALQRLSLEGRAAVERSEFVYMAALRRLSSLSRLEYLAVDGPIFACGAAAGGGGAAAADFAADARLDGAAVVGSLAAALTALTSLHLASVPPAASAAPARPQHAQHGEEGQQQQHEQQPGHGEDDQQRRRVACSWRALPLSAFAGLSELSLREPRRLHDGFWAELAELRCSGGAGGEGLRGVGRGGGSVGDASAAAAAAGGKAGGFGLRSLCLTVASSGILDELPGGALAGVTRLHLAGVQLDSLSLLARLRSLTHLALELPADGCDAARRHNVALLTPLTTLTRLELRSACAAMSGAGAGAGAAAPVGAGAARGGTCYGAFGGGVEGRGAVGEEAGTAGRGASGMGGESGGRDRGGSGEQLLLNDARLQALARSLRRLAALSFHGTLQVSDSGVGALGSGLMRLTALEMFNDSDAPSSVALQLLPPSLERLSLYGVTVALPPTAAAGAEQQQPVVAPGRSEARGGRDGGARAGGSSNRERGGSFGAGPTDLSLLPRCRVLHLDYCRGAPTWRLLPCLGSSTGTGSRGVPRAAATAAHCVLEELRLQHSHAASLSLADAAAVAALPRLRKLQVSCASGQVSDYALTRMLSPPVFERPAAAGASAAGAVATQPASPLLSCLSLRLPSTPLSLANLRALGRLVGLRSLFLDAPPPQEAGLVAAELRCLSSLTALTLGPVYGRDCCLQPALLPVLGQLQAALLTCRIQQAC